MILIIFTGQKTLSSKVDHYPQINLCTQFSPIKMPADDYFSNNWKANSKVNREMLWTKKKNPQKTKTVFEKEKAGGLTL